MNRMLNVKMEVWSWWEVNKQCWLESQCSSQIEAYDMPVMQLYGEQKHWQGVVGFQVVEVASQRRKCSLG